MNDGVKITRPVNTTDIGTVLQTSSRNVGYLCSNKHKLINIWSKNKPVRYDLTSALEDWQRKFVNYGFDMDYCSSIDINNLFINSKETPQWVYLPPTDGNWYRMLDFNKYNHKAVEPFSYRSFPQIIETVVDKASVLFRILKNSLAEIDMADLAYFDGDSNVFKYALACRKAGSNEISIYYGPTVNEATNEILIDVEFSSTGNWEVLFIATRETGLSPLNLGSVYMPYGYHTVLVKKVTSYGRVTLTSKYNLSLSSDGVIRGFHPVDLTVLAVNKRISTTTARFLLNVFYYDSTGKVIGDFVVDDASGNFTYEGNIQKEYSLDFLLGDSIAISAYDPSISIDDVHHVQMTADLKTVTGLGVMIFDREYKWEINKTMSKQI